MDSKIEFLKKLAAEVPDEPKSKPKGDKPDPKKEKQLPFKKAKPTSDEGKGPEGVPGHEESESPGHEKSETPGQESAEHAGGGEEKGVGGEKEIPGNESAEGAAVPGGATHPSTVIDFLASNPNPDDESFHEFAEQNGLDIHSAESIAYALASKYVQFLRGGKSAGMDMSTVNPQELEMGLQVESEHTDDPTTQKKIALDHLAEMPDYYTKLQQMENGGGSGGSGGGGGGTDGEELGGEEEKKIPEGIPKKK